MLLDLLEDLAGEDDDGGGAVADLCVLRSGNVDEDASGGVHDIEELRQYLSAVAGQRDVGVPHLHDGRAVVCDGLPAILVDHEHVAAIGPEGGLDGGLDGKTGVDV